ncbi:MAG: anhydro-N-acetylmuramic acid kinase [Vulcanimicrobiaceae bacterium]
MRAIGLMSGSSLDGIDAALVALRPRGEGYEVRLERATCAPFEAEFAVRLRAALPPNVPSQADAGSLERALAERFATAAELLLDGRAPDFVASHGLTLYHDGARGISRQLGDPYVLRERLQATVLCDFRRADCALGGHGAPLVPAVDAMLFADPRRDVVALNLGGIANLTVLPVGAPRAEVRAWDIGPCNLVLDGFVRARSGGALAYDPGGALAAAGHADAALARQLLENEPYFAAPPPKSTGRERFGEPYLATIAPLLAALSLEDGCATLVAFVAETVAEAMVSANVVRPRVVASGGGLRNATLRAALARELAAQDGELVDSGTFGIDPDAKEAIAFAILGYELLRGRAAGLPSVTGAVRPALLGAIVPHRVHELLAKVAAETAGSGLR